MPLFGAGPYDPALERDSIAFEEQLRGLEEVVKSGKVGRGGPGGTAGAACCHSCACDALLQRQLEVSSAGELWRHESGAHFTAIKK